MKDLASGCLGRWGLRPARMECGLAGLVAVSALIGQTTDVGITDGTTPPEAAAATPAGSYALSKVDTVDPYTGMVNINIPLAKVNSRGEAGYTLSLPIQRIWQIRGVILCTGQCR